MNDSKKIIVKRVSIVLIDTWWNVNVIDARRGFLNEKVLIDTWWNVNSELVSQLEYIHEVLIDTWWNVNDYDNIVFGINCEF